MHVPRRDRVSVFREFVLQSFTEEYLKSGPVLDVAGGKGDLSWLLANAHGVDAVVVDPRATDHRKIVRTALWYWEHRDEDLESIVFQRGPQGPLATLRLQPPFATPQHLRLPMDAALLEALDGAAADEAFWNEAFARAKEAHQSEHHQKKTVEVDDLSKHCAPPRNVNDPVDARRLLESAKLVLGFHPDQATEACVDLALRLRVPFVVCPCCVFPAEFPDRNVDGKLVKTYDEFITYLWRKHPRIRVAKLDFEQIGGQACNIALYMCPQDFAPSCADEVPPPTLLAPPLLTRARAHDKPDENPRVRLTDLIGGQMLRPCAFAASETDDEHKCRQVASAARDHCVWRSTAMYLTHRHVLSLRSVSRRWSRVCFVLRFHDHPLPAKRRYLRTTRMDLLQALAAFQLELENSDVTSAFRQRPSNTDAWKQLNTALSAGVDEGLLTEFNQREAQVGYFLSHLLVRCWHLPHVLLSEEALLQRIRQNLLFPLSDNRAQSDQRRGETSQGVGAPTGFPCCQIASLGGGPGYDAIGLALMAAAQHLHVRFEVVNYDIEPTWDELVHAIDKHLCAPLGHGTSFNVCDITAGLTHDGPNAALLSRIGPAGTGFDMYVIAFVVATNARQLEATGYAFFRQLFAKARLGATFIFMDATHRHWAQLVAVASKEGLFEAALPRFEQGKGLHGFPKHTLVLYKQCCKAVVPGDPSMRDVADRLQEFEAHRQAHGRRWMKHAACGKHDDAADNSSEEVANVLTVF